MYWCTHTPNANMRVMCYVCHQNNINPFWVYLWVIRERDFTISFDFSITFNLPFITHPHSLACFCWTKFLGRPGRITIYEVHCYILMELQWYNFSFQRNKTLRKYLLYFTRLIPKHTTNSDKLKETIPRRRIYREKCSMKCKMCFQSCVGDAISI